MSKENNILRRYVGEKETEDCLNYAPFYKFFGNNSEPGDYITKKNNYSYNCESSAIQIEEVYNICSELTKKGATHIEIVYHEDHDGYIFNGVELKKATKEDIERHNSKLEILSKKSLLKKKESLKKEIQKIDNKLNAKWK